MHFSTTAFITLLTALVASASPVPGVEAGLDWEHDWEHKWNHNDWRRDHIVFYFDRSFLVKADPDQVRNGTTAVPGEPGARGLFKFGINVQENTICYNITLSGVTGDYKSPALTATHMHEARRGESGPPRLSFPNPMGPDEKRVSYGCLTGPFKTGVAPNGTDTGANFHVRQIVANPAGFFSDTHTTKYTLGAVRGQLA